MIRLLNQPTQARQDTNTPKFNLYFEHQHKISPCNSQTIEVKIEFNLKSSNDKPAPTLNRRFKAKTVELTENNM